MWSINVDLRLLKATIEFLWWVGWGGVHNTFHVQPNYIVEVVRCVVAGVVTKKVPLQLIRKVTLT